VTASILVPPASAHAVELDAGWAIRITDPEGSQVGDLDHLAAALSAYGVSTDAVEAPLDLFMHTEVASDGSLIIHRSPSLPGDHVILRAEADLVVALAACADDVTDCNGGRCGPLVIELLPPAETLERSSSEPPTRAS
jgi:uncharacterized protein YcgI (DUF1989 family)